VDPQSVKIVVAGGFGSGKTTLVGSVSEIPPLTTEELLTDASTPVDDLTGIEAKTNTTVALDFGRITVDPSMVLYLFGTPGQGRFWFMWDELSRGAVGAVVLADPRRLDTSFSAIDYFEDRGLPFIVAVNLFDGHCDYPISDIRSALKISETTPIVLCDARNRADSHRTLIRLVRHALSHIASAAPQLDGDVRDSTGGVR
jgi:signal recognition particle receptor subunit beta